MIPKSKVLDMRGVRVECRRHPLLWYGLHAQDDVHRFYQTGGIGWSFSCTAPPSSAPAPPLVHGTDQYAIDVELDLAVSCAIKTVRVIVVRWIQVGNRGFVIDFFGVHRSCGSVEAMEIVRHFQTVVYRRGDCLYDVNFTGQALEPK